MKRNRFFWMLFFILTHSALTSAEADVSRLKQLGFTVPAERSEAPEILVTDETGRNRQSLPEKGYVTLMTFWTTWCPPCRAEMPSLQRLYEILESEGLKIRAVNMNEEVSYVQDFMENMDLALPIVYFPDETYLGAYNLKGIPASYLIDSRGRIAAVIKDSASWDNPLIIRTIRELLEEKP